MTCRDVAFAPRAVVWLFCLACLVMATGHAASGQPASQPMISLAGVWRFSLDADSVGEKDRWFTRTLGDTITLPGTTDEHHKGIRSSDRATDRLSRVWYWKGPAWYQRDVTIPDDWRGQRITLLLERTKHTRIWVDDTPCGSHDSLSTPHVFDVTDVMTPGNHTITVEVDNAKLPPVGPSHAVDERTQTNWNGIIGRMELLATDPIWVEDVQVYPEALAKRAKVRVVIGSLVGQPATGQVTVSGESSGVASPATFAPKSIAVEVREPRTTVDLTYAPGGDVPLWDEFTPTMLCLRVELATTADGRSFRDQRSVRFGMRDITADASRLRINGRRLFLRGKLDCAVFPLTGYPPMDKEGWKRLLAISRSYGINHYRFHSWCPPKAAFEAADELGLYLQIELPNKRSGFHGPENREAALHNVDDLDVDRTPRGTSLYDFGTRESELIFKHYGNHPSFVLYTLGNELGHDDGMAELVANFKRWDPRHLYAQASNQTHWNPTVPDGDQFWVGAALKDATGTPLPLRGASAAHSWVKGHIDNLPPSTLIDYAESLAGVPVPVIVHEMGEFQVAPDFREISEYTGVTRAHNLETFRERLRAAGMLDQAHDFMRASGTLSVICHREDIEAILRTPGIGGFHLLDIQDFPGQGTALVGILNALMQSKGLITPEAWRQFCCETVPLLRMKKYTWTTDETFIGRVQVAHYGPADIPQARVSWTVTDSAGRTIASHRFCPVSIEQGKVFDVDSFAVPLARVAAPQKLTVTIGIEGTPYRNSYPVWVYPARVDTAEPPGVMVARRFGHPKTRAHLAAGGKVLLLPDLDALPHSVGGQFQSEFWSPMFAASALERGIEPPPGTLGILCDPAAPALARFPTAFHSEWQWWHLVKNARPIMFDDTPDDYRPIVQVIDNFVTNHKLGLLAETRVGDGRMLICAIDLLGLQDKPEARQLLHSLLRYMESDAFAPSETLDMALLEKLLPTNKP
jgi:hypothetical protein